jgi:hypothetical protein
MITQGDLIIRHHKFVFVIRLRIVDIVAWFMITQGDLIIRHHKFVFVSRLRIVGIVAWFIFPHKMNYCQHWSCKIYFFSKQGALDSKICDKICQVLAACQWVSLGTLKKPI